MVSANRFILAFGVLVLTPESVLAKLGQENGQTDKKDGPSGIRFSKKINFPATSIIALAEMGITLPLGPDDYPMSHELADVLRTTTCPSVITPDDYEVSQSVEEMIDLVGGEPDHAPTLGFWPYFLEVVEYQQIRRANDHVLGSEIFTTWDLPETWKDFTVGDISEAVHDEFPGANQVDMITSFLHNGGIAIDNDLIPKRSKAQFLHGPVLLSNLNTWSVDMVGPTNFAAKYHVGRARPEEVGWAVRCSLPDATTIAGCNNVHTFDLASGEVPQQVIDAVKSLNLHSMQEFGKYPEGSPQHGSWPAMHSAASNISLWLAVVANLTPEQLHEAKKLDFAVSWGRTVAGVHYRDDNIAGLAMGQEIVARELPHYLASKYGADPMKVRAKIEQMRFDWKEVADEMLGGNDYNLYAGVLGINNDKLK